MTLEPALAELLTGAAATQRLGLTVDPEPLRDELRAWQRRPWRHQRPYSAGGVGNPISSGWKCLPLRSPGGSLERTDPGGPAIVPFAPTPALERMPAFAALLESLPCELRAARLLALEPGTVLDEHTDKFVGFGYGQVRLHVPVVTNPGAVLHIEGADHHWEPGQLWYANFTRPHSVRNAGSERRIHLVVDCMVTERLLDLFPAPFRRRMAAQPYVRNRPRRESRPLGKEVGFVLPAAIGADLIADLPADADPSAAGVRAWVRDEDGAPTLSTERGARCRLVEVAPDEYRFEGWTEERTLALADLPRRITLHDRREWTTRTVHCPVLEIAT